MTGKCIYLMEIFNRMAKPNNMCLSTTFFIKGSSPARHEHKEELKALSIYEVLPG